MSEYVVITAFRDKDTLKHYSVGDSYKSDDAERISFLQEEGYLGDEAHADYDGDGQLKHVGGGYYELPNGEKVRGKNKALEKLKEFEESPPAE